MLDFQFFWESFGMRSIFVKVFIASIDPVETIIIFYYNGSQLKNPDISGAIHIEFEYTNT